MRGEGRPEHQALQAVADRPGQSCRRRAAVNDGRPRERAPLAVVTGVAVAEVARRNALVQVVVHGVHHRNAGPVRGPHHPRR